jgi:branched-chain amino acid transport system ATP-binding protein
MLEFVNVTSGYGRIEALHGVSLGVRKGEIATIIGANGAGKTTLLMTLFGCPPAWSGRILLDGRDVTKAGATGVAIRGVAIAPEGRRVFAKMTVQENLQLGALRADATELAQRMGAVLNLFPELAERRVQLAGTMSGGEQQMLAIGRALMARPRLLVLDEPSLGLAPLVARRIFAAVRRINREQGVTVLLVEQNAHAALTLADEAFVLRTGRIMLAGPAQAVAQDADVKSLYLAA